MAAPVSYYASVSELFMVYNVYLGFFDKHGCTYWWIKKQSAHCKHVPCSTLTHSTNDDLLSIKRKGDPKSRTFSCTFNTTKTQALVSFKKYMPPPLPYFKVNICPFPLPHFASIFFAYFVILSLTQLYRYTLEIFLFTTATFKYTYRAPLRRIGQEYQRTYLVLFLRHWNGYSHFRSGLNWFRKLKRVF